METALTIIMFFFTTFFTMALISLFFPVKFASFLPKSFCPSAKRGTVFSRYLIISVVFFVLGVILTPKQPDNKPAELAKSEQVAQVKQEEPKAKEDPKTQEQPKVQEQQTQQSSQVQVTENKNGEVTITVFDDDAPKTTVQSPAVQDNTDLDEEEKKLEAECASYKKEFIALYDELMSFRYKSKFHSLGFSAKSPYSGWMQRVEKAEKKYSDQAQLRTELILGELKQIALIYMRNNGNDDDISNFILKDMKKAMKK